MFAALALAAVTAISVGHSPSHRSPGSQSDMVITSLTAGEADPDGVVPTVNGVPGAGVNNWDISIPVAVVEVGGQYVYALTVHDIDYTGSCSAMFKLTQMQSGKRVTLDSGELLGGTCQGDLVYLTSAAGRPVPNAPGAATLSATVHFGSNKTSLKVPLTIE
ncbi:MAG TPA: hypothetical protein VGF97_13350 [Rhizomicrobium sp.]|jgi:hypothetical protein